MAPIRIIHLSDPHLAERPRLGQMNIKRFLGRLNWLSKRRFSHDRKRLDVAVQEILFDDPDAVVITGDFGQLGLPQEIKAISEALHPLREAGIPVLLTTGNHDYYGWNGEMAHEIDAFRKKFSLAVPIAPNGTACIGNLEILLLQQACPTKLFEANGKVDKSQMEAMSAASPTGAIRIAAGHFPLVNAKGYAIPKIAGLRNAVVFRRWLEALNVRAYLCGHIHHPFRFELFPGCTQCCAGSITASGTLNRIAIDDDGTLRFCERYS